MPSCAVYFCRNTDKNCTEKISFFTFPKEPVLLKKWIKACNRNDTIIGTSERVCSVHFKEDDFANFSQYLYGFKPILKTTVIPSLHLKANNIGTTNNSEYDQTKRGTRLKKRCIRKDALERLKTLSPKNKSISKPKTVICNLTQDEAILLNMKEQQVINSIHVQEASNLIPGVQEETNFNQDVIQDVPSVPKPLRTYLRKSQDVQKTPNSIQEVQTAINCNSIKAVRHYSTDHYYSYTRNNFEDMKREIENLKAKNKDLTNKLMDTKRTTLVLEAKLTNRNQQIIRSKQLAERWKMKWFDATKNLKKQTDLEKCSRILNKIFTRAQIRHLKNEKRVQWAKDDIDNAIALQKLGVKTYTYVRDQLKIPLPGLSTLRRWNSNPQCDSGILKNLLIQ